MQSPLDAPAHHFLLQKPLDTSGDTFKSASEKRSERQQIVNYRKEDVPNQEIASYYTIAMHFGQQLELNLRAILYTADYHGWGDELSLTQEQRQRYRAKDGFIDKATCGAIITALRKVRLVRADALLDFFERACSHRNKLAHSFLSDQDFSHITKEQESQLATSLQNMADDLYKGMRFSRALRGIVETEADMVQKNLKESLGDCLGPDYNNPNRKYATRQRKTKRQ